VSEPDPSDVKPCAPGSTSCPHRELCWVESPWAGLSPPYSTIVADPPWHYDARVIEWGRAEPMPYSTMTLDEIAALPVTDLSRPGAHLYLWTTNRYLDDAFDVARAWGFDPVTTLVWCKEPHGQGPGGRFAITTEFILFARDRRRSGDVIRAAREAAGLSRGVPLGGRRLPTHDGRLVRPSGDPPNARRTSLPVRRGVRGSQGGLDVVPMGSRATLRQARRIR
jgi:hypothetical protein